MRTALTALLSLLLLLAAAGAQAGCPPHERSAPERVRLAGDAVLVVTHATSAHDARLATKRGVDEAVRLARDRRMPVIYLEDDGPQALYFMDDCQPDHWLHSEGGEIAVDMTPGRLFVAGGHLEMCLSVTLHDVLLDWARKPARNLSVTLLMDAIYSNGKLVEESDPYFADFERFMAVVTYGRAGGEHWPKLTLLETLGVIRDPRRQLDYLQRALPHYERSFPPDYRVEMRINDGPPRVLQPGRGRGAPRLSFDFVDSALLLAEQDSGLRSPRSDQ